MAADPWGRPLEEEPLAGPSWTLIILQHLLLRFTWPRSGDKGRRGGNMLGPRTMMRVIHYSAAPCRTQQPTRSIRFDAKRFSAQETWAVKCLPMTTSSDKQSTLILLSAVERVPGHFQPNKTLLMNVKHISFCHLKYLLWSCLRFPFRAADSPSGDESNFCLFEQLASASLKLASATKLMLVFEG